MTWCNHKEKFISIISNNNDDNFIKKKKHTYKKTQKNIHMPVLKTMEADKRQDLQWFPKYITIWNIFSDFENIFSDFVNIFGLSVISFRTKLLKTSNCLL